MQRRRLIELVCLVLLLAGGLAALLLANRRPKEASFMGHTARYWLREAYFNSGQLAQAIEAFNQMGTNAEPAIIATLRPESPLAKMYRLSYHHLPPFVGKQLAEPCNPDGLRGIAMLVVYGARTITFPRCFPCCQRRIPRPVK